MTASKHGLLRLRMRGSDYVCNFVCIRNRIVMHVLLCAIHIDYLPGVLD